MADNEDYRAHLGRLLADPASWSLEEVATARSLLRNQQSAIASLHPKAHRLRASMQAVADSLAEALRVYDGQG